MTASGNFLPIAPRQRPSSLAWALSAMFHGVLVLALAAALGHGHHHHEPSPPPARLVYVEPAPASAAPLGDPKNESATTTPPTEPQQQLPVPAPVRPVPAKRVAAPRREQPLSDRKRRHAPPREDAGAAAPPLAAEPPPASHQASTGAGTTDGVAAARGDSVGGTRDGVAGGTVGGLGDAPRALRDVASPPELLDRVLPEYPSRARAQEIEGQVVLAVVLDRGGRIESSIRVVRSVPLLDEAAIAAVRQWRFRPARDRDGRSVRVQMEIPVRFVLH